MNSTDQRRLRQATTRAAERRLRTRAEVERRGVAPTPRPGDVFAFAETAGFSVLWVVLDQIATTDPSNAPSFLLVAADLNPLTGSTDVATPADSAFGSLSLRCGFELHLAAADFESAKLSGSLESDVVDRARRKRHQIDTGTVTGSAVQRDTDDEPEYVDWLQEGPAAAQAALGKRADAISGSHPTLTLNPTSVADWIRSEKVDPDVLHLLRHVHRLASQPHMGPPATLELEDVARAGWAIVFAGDEAEDVQEAMRPLIEHRRSQIGREKTKILEVRRSESWREWLARHGVAAAHAQLTEIPHYLLLVGSPTKIPYDFQTLLGIEYAVGRLSFETVDEYRHYAESVIDDETSGRPPLGANEALICQGWPAPARIDDTDSRFTARDLTASNLTGEVSVQGRVAWLRASHSLGMAFGEPFPAVGEDLPPEATIAPLPQQLLAHPGGGALAVIGLVERAWGPVDKVSEARLRSLEGTLESLLSGTPVGHAILTLKRRYAELSVELHQLRKKMALGAKPPGSEIVALWSERNEARNTLLLGDPAVRLRVDDRDG